MYTYWKACWHASYLCWWLATCCSCSWSSSDLVWYCRLAWGGREGKVTSLCGSASADVTNSLICLWATVRFMWRVRLYPLTPRASHTHTSLYFLALQLNESRALWGPARARGSTMCTCECACMRMYMRPRGMVAVLWVCQEEKIADTSSARRWSA